MLLITLQNILTLSTNRLYSIRIVKIKEISRRGRLQNSLTLGTNIIDFADIEGEGVKYVAVIYGSSLMFKLLAEIPRKVG